MNKPKNKKEVVKILKDSGFVLVSSNKHEKWKNSDGTILCISNSHGQFHKIGHWQILKRAGLL